MPHDAPSDTPPASARPTRRLVHEAQSPIGCTAGEIDLHALRRCFGALFDRAAHQVYCAGSDLDHSLLERYVICSTPKHAQVKVAADGLADAARLTQNVVSQVCESTGEVLEPGEIHIIAAAVSAWLDTWP